MLSPGASFTASWLREPRLIGDQPMRGTCHTVRGGIDPEDHPFRLWVVEFADVWRGFVIRGWSPVLPRYRESIRCPEGQLTLCAGPTSSTKSAARWWGWFHTVRDGTDPRDVAVSVPALLGLDVWQAVLIRGWASILP